MSVRGIYINLDRSPDRRAEVEAELSKLGPDHGYRRFPAIDAGDAAVRPDVANRAQLGCFLSHLEVIESHVGFDEWLHVMEDDVVISRYAGAAIAALTSDPAYAIYDVIFTNVRLWAGVGVTANMRELFDHSVTVGPSGEVTAVNSLAAVSLRDVDFFLCTSYLVNPRSIGRTAELLAGYRDAQPFRQVDLAFSELSRSGALQIAFAMPFFTMPRLGAVSTVQSGVHHWTEPLAIMDAMFYADRDVPDLRRRLGALARAPASLTAEMIAEASAILVANGS